MTSGWTLKAKERLCFKDKVDGSAGGSVLCAGLSLVSRAHGRRENPPPRGIPELCTWAVAPNPPTHTNSKLIVKVVRVSGKQYPCLHTYKYARTHARQIYLETETRRGGRWGAGRL